MIISVDAEKHLMRFMLTKIKNNNNKLGIVKNILGKNFIPKPLM